MSQRLLQRDIALGPHVIRASLKGHKNEATFWEESGEESGPLVWSPALESLPIHYLPYTKLGPILLTPSTQGGRGQGPKLSAHALNV